MHCKMRPAVISMQKRALRYSDQAFSFAKIHFLTSAIVTLLFSAIFCPNQLTVILHCSMLCCCMIESNSLGLLAAI